MFLKSKPATVGKIATTGKKDMVPSIIGQDFHLLGNIVSDGIIDFDGTIDGNIRCHTLNIRKHAAVKGEVVADDVFVYGKVKGIIRAKNVYLFSSCRIEGIVMHESIAIEDGAFIDGKCKRTDKPQDAHADEADSFEEEETTAGDIQVLENIRLISR